MKNIATRAAIAGFFVPIFWGILGFILFNAPESKWTDMFWDAVYITCPFWAIPGLLGRFSMPFLNAGLYAIGAIILYQATISFRRGRSSSV